MPPKVIYLKCQYCEEVLSDLEQIIYGTECAACTTKINDVLAQAAEELEGEN
jgi:hypothetical protein